MSKLVEFLKWWLAEAESDKPHFVVIRFGLCWNWDNFTGYCGDDLGELFKDMGLDTAYPFGCEEYWQRVDDLTQHQDPNRLAWVRKYLADHG